MGKKFLLPLLFILLFGCTFASTVTRSFSPTAVQPGADLTVTLTVDVTGSETFYAIDENVPTGWTVKNPGTGSIQQAGHLKWMYYNKTVVAPDTTYTYILTAPSQAGTVLFSGAFMFEGMETQAQIAGQNTVSVVCATASQCPTGQLCCSGACAAPRCIADANCNDLNLATRDSCNSPNTCDANCVHTLITQCTNNDGYCPSGCNSISDNDCPLTCNNEIAESGENCANCPVDVKCSSGTICCETECIAAACTLDAACDDDNPCTLDSCSKAGQCTAQCVNAPIAGCGQQPPAQPPGQPPGGPTTENLVVSVQGECLNQPISVEVQNGDAQPEKDVTVKLLRANKTIETKTTASEGKVSFSINAAGEYVVYATKPGFYTTTKSIQVKECAAPPKVEFQPNIETGEPQTITIMAGDGTAIQDFNVMLVFPDKTTATLSTKSGAIVIPIEAAGAYTATVQAVGFQESFSFEARRPFQIMPNITSEATPAVATVFGPETAATPNYLIIWLLAIVMISGLLMIITRLKPLWFRVFMTSTYTTLPFVVRYYSGDIRLAFVVIAIQTTVLTAVWFRQWKKEKIGQKKEQIEWKQTAWKETGAEKEQGQPSTDQTTEKGWSELQRELERVTEEGKAQAAGEEEESADEGGWGEFAK